MTEAEWQAQVLELATLCRWHVFHPPANLPRRTATGRVWVQNVRAGWPDLTLWRPPEFFLAELKTDTGRLRPDQSRVIDELRACGLEVHVWRPRDWKVVAARLGARVD